MLTLTTATSSRNNDTNTTSNVTTTVKTLNNNNRKNSSLNQGNGHVCMFIHDVTSSSISSSHSCTIQNNNNDNNSNNSDMFKTKNGIVYQRVRLNGILVSQSNESMNIWLDDGTDTIRVILSQRLLARADAPKLTISASVTVFGLVKHLDNEFMIQCGGFHVETDVSNELYHSIKVLSCQSYLPPTSTTIAAKSIAITTTEETDKENINMNNKNSNIKNANNTNNFKIAQKPVALFHSLSSQPSPPPSHPVELIISTPEQKNPQSSSSSSNPVITPTSSSKTGAAAAGGIISQFAWSPEQPLATSTPLIKDSLRESPLRIQSNKNKNNRTPNSNNIMLLNDGDDDDDEIFGELDISFSRIEKEATTATRSKPQKRRWEP